MRLIRVNLDEEDFLWLQREARRQHRSISAVFHDLVVQFSGNDDGSRVWKARRPAPKTGTEGERLTRLLGRPSPLERRLRLPSRRSGAK